MTFEALSTSSRPSTFRDLPEGTPTCKQSSIQWKRGSLNHQNQQNPVKRSYNRHRTKPSHHQKFKAVKSLEGVFLADVSCTSCGISSGFQRENGTGGNNGRRSNSISVSEKRILRVNEIFFGNFVPLEYNWQRCYSRSQTELDTLKSREDLESNETKTSGSGSLHLLRGSDGRGREAEVGVEVVEVVANVLSSSCDGGASIEAGLSDSDNLSERIRETKVSHLYLKDDSTSSELSNDRGQSHSGDISQSNEENSYRDAEKLDRRDTGEVSGETEVEFFNTSMSNFGAKGDQSDGKGPSSYQEKFRHGVAKVDALVDETVKGKIVEIVAPLSKNAVFQSTQKSNHVKSAWEALVRWSRSWRLSKINEENALVKTTKIAVFGGGSFGTAMGVMLARNKADMDVILLLRNPTVCDEINNHQTNKKFFPNHVLPANVRATTDPREALDGAQYCIHAVPVQASTEFLKGLAEFIPPTLPILSVSKGLEVSTLEMMSQVIPRALGNPRQPVAVLSGPTFSIELMDRRPTAIVAASKDKQLARAAQQLLASRYLRVNTSSDVVGVEMAGALKNVLAIAAGIVEGMNLGNNCMAALVAQGCAEIRWLAEKMGANPATLSGLSGTGDIMLTCFVSLSRNRSVGVRLGAGEKLEDILASMNQVAEGVATAGAVIALARKYRVQMPVLTAVARILENELTPKRAVMELMTLPQVEER